MGCAILPHLKSLVEIIEHGMSDFYVVVVCKLLILIKFTNQLIIYRIG